MDPVSLPAELEPLLRLLRAGCVRRFVGGGVEIELSPDAGASEDSRRRDAGAASASGGASGGGASQPLNTAPLSDEEFEATMYGSGIASLPGGKRPPEEPEE